jgi:hypothetical protein
MPLQFFPRGQRHCVDVELLFRTMLAAEGILQRPVELLPALPLGTSLPVDGGRLTQNHLLDLSLDELGTLLVLPAVLPVEKSHVGLLLLGCVCVGGQGGGLGLPDHSVVVLRGQQWPEGALLQFLLPALLLLLLPLLLILALLLQVFPRLSGIAGTTESKYVYSFRSWCEAPLRAWGFLEKNGYFIFIANFIILKIHNEPYCPCWPSYQVQIDICRIQMKGIGNFSILFIFMYGGSSKIKDQYMK